MDEEFLNSIDLIHNYVEKQFAVLKLDVDMAVLFYEEWDQVPIIKTAHTKMKALSNLELAIIDVLKSHVIEE